MVKDDEKKQLNAICMKLLDAISDMLNLSLELKAALIQREKEKIWELLSKKEEKAALINQFTELYRDLFPDEDSKSSISIERQLIKNQLAQLQRIEQHNTMLSRSYLNAIDKAMVKMGVGSKKKTYTKFGKQNKKNKSLLINRMG